jgi:hypothetical protein
MARLSDRQLCGDEFGLMSVADGSSTTSEAPKAADRFAAESGHRRSNDCSVTLT